MTTRAVVIGDQGHPELREVPVPQLDEDEILVRVRAVGLNAAAVAGRDGMPLRACGYAGIVEDIGSGVTKELKKGDRVAGVARGAAEGVVLAEYVAAKGDLQMAIPDGVGDAEAAALGGPLSVVCQALYGALQLPLPPASWFAPQSLLIHGGDTPAGRLGIQFARRSGLTVLATQSNSSTRAGEEDEEAVLRALGAAAVFDAGPACAAEIRARARDRLTLAWDCTGGAGVALCAAALSSTEGGVYYATGAGAGVASPDVDPTAVNPRVAAPREVPAAVAAAVARVYHATGGRPGGADADADAEDAYELARGFWACAQSLLESGDLNAAGARELNRGAAGLEGVLRGLEALKTASRDQGVVYTL